MISVIGDFAQNMLRAHEAIESDCIHKSQFLRLNGLAKSMVLVSRNAELNAHKRISWLPELDCAKKLSFFFSVSATLLFIGIYCAIDIALPNGGTLPMLSAAPGLLLMLLQPRMLSKKLFRFTMIPVVTVALFCAFSPSPTTMYINRLNSLAQVGYGMLISYVACWALLRTGRKRLNLVLAITIPFYLALLALETLSPTLQDLVRNYQDVVYPTNQDLDMLINRERGMGGYRPKFFTSETSFVGISVLILITGFLWTGRSLGRYLWAVAYTFIGFIIVRSPIIVLLMPIILTTALTDPLYSRYRILIGGAVGLGLALAAGVVMLFRGDVVTSRLQNAASGQDFSVTFRTYGSVAVAIEVLRKYPVLGVGPGGLDLAKNEIIATELRLGVPARAVDQAWKISIANAPSSLAVHFGIVGFLFGNFILYQLIASSTRQPLLPIFTGVAVWGIAYGAVYTPKFLVTLFVLVVLARLRDGQVNLPPDRPSVITRVQRLNTTAPAPAQARRA